MRYEKLLQQRRIRAYRSNPQEVDQLLSVASRDLATASKVLHQDLDWTFNILYNAVLQAARALVLHQGFRPRGPDQHRTVVEFCRLTLGPEHSGQIAFFDQMRRKRHRLVYEVVGLVSRQEAEQVFSFARKFVDTIQEWITAEPQAS